MTITPAVAWMENNTSQATKKAKINEIINAINAISSPVDWQGSVLERLATPPAHVDGERYLIIATASGDWTGKEDQIAESDGAAWSYTLPSEGMRVWIEDVNQGWQYITSWAVFWDQATTTTSLVTFLNLILTGLTASQIVETNGSKQLISASKNTGYNKVLGTGSGQVSEGNHAHSTYALWNLDNSAVTRSANFGAAHMSIMKTKDANSFFWWFDTTNHWADSTINGTFHVPLNIPHGATVTAWKGWNQRGAGAMSITLRRITNEDGTDITMASYPSTSSMANGSETSITSPVIDNTLYSYYAEIITTGSTEKRIRNVEVVYTVVRPQP